MLERPGLGQAAPAAPIVRPPHGPTWSRSSLWARARRWISAIAATALAPLALAGELVVDVLDVGQGDAILVRAGGKTVLIDAGTAGANVALRLQAMGVYTIDLLIATHAHADHIGGMEDVVRALRVQRYLDSGQAHTTQTWARLADALSVYGTSVLATAPGQVIKLSDDVLLKVLGPPATPFAQTRSDLNANSVVLLIDHGDVELLLPGDAEAPTEEWLVANGLPDIEVLKVAHHGSSHSSIPGLLRAASPELAVISVGVDNRYGHPGEDTLKRLSDVGATVLRTDQVGTITLRSNGAQVSVTSERGAALKLTAQPDALAAP